MSDGNALLSTLDGFRRNADRDVVRLVLGLRLEGKESTQFLLHSAAVFAGGLEQRKYLVV